MKRLVNYFVIIFFVTAIISQAQPQTNNMKHNKKFQLFNQLNLSAEQEQQIKDLRYQQQKKAIDLKSQVEKNRLEIKHQITSDNFDENKILELTEANSKIQAELKTSKIKTWLAINKLLTPEQQKIWKKHFEKAPRLIREKIRHKMDRFRNERMMKHHKFSKPQTENEQIPGDE